MTLLVKYEPKTKMKTKRQTLSMKLKADEGQKQKWDFAISQEILKTSKGIPTGIHAVIRNDTGEMIGSYSDEKASPYPNIVAAFEAGLAKLTNDWKREKILVTSNGGRLFADYLINTITVGGETFGCYVRLLSSHNGTQKAGFMFYVKRLSCFNGMMLADKIFSIFKRHAKDLDLSFLDTELHTAVEAGQNHVRESLDKMQGIALDNTLAMNICSNIVALGATKGVGERAGYFMFHNWMNPSADETALGNTLYRLYNAATRWTRDIEALNRFEMGNKANLYISGAFGLAARNHSQLERLLSAPVVMLDFGNMDIIA